MDFLVGELVDVSRYPHLLLLVKSVRHVLLQGLILVRLENLLELGRLGLRLEDPFQERFKVLPVQLQPALVENVLEGFVLAGVLDVGEGVEGEVLVGLGELSPSRLQVLLENHQCLLAGLPVGSVPSLLMGEVTT